MRVAAAIVLVLLIAGCSQPAAGSRSDEQARQDLLTYVAGLRGTGVFPATTAPYVVEVAWANGLPIDAWPAEHPALGDVVVPSGGALLPALRPLHALALADAPGADGRRDRVLTAFDGTQFGEPALLNDDAFAILALVADGEPASSPEVQASASFLLAHRSGGGWSFAVGGDPGVDLTGMVLSALAAAGRLADVPAGEVVAFLQEARVGAGFAEGPGGTPNCDSTVWALRAFALLGQEIAPGAWGFLRTLQGDGLGIRYLPTDQAPNPLCSIEVATLWGLRATGRLGVAPV